MGTTIIFSCFILAEDGILFVDESNLDIQLPRGYRMKLISPVIIPEEAVWLQAGQMCLKLDYILNGEDAFTFTVQKKYVGSSSGFIMDFVMRNSSFKESDSPLIFAQGPQGDRIISESIDFSVSQPFQV